MRLGFFLVALILLASVAAGPAIFLAAPAMAQPRRDPGVLPLDRILPGVRRSYPGDFYDADGPTPGPDGLEHYHLKWMTPDGRIQWLDTDARTGRVLNSAPGRDAFDSPGTRRFFPQAPSFPVGPGFEEGRDRGGPMGPGFQDRRERGAEPFRGGERGGYDNGRGRRGR